MGGLIDRFGGFDLEVTMGVDCGEFGEGGLAFEAGHCGRRGAGVGEAGESCASGHRLELYRRLPIGRDDKTIAGACSDSSDSVRLAGAMSCRWFIAVAFWWDFERVESVEDKVVKCG